MMFAGLLYDSELLKGMTVPGSSAKAPPPIATANMAFKMATNVTKRARKTFSREASSRRAHVLLSPGSVGA